MDNDTIKTDFALQTECEGIAKDAIDEWVRDNPEEDEIDLDEINERIWQDVDGSQYVIYTYRALQICANCSTDDGEAFVEDIGGWVDGETFNSMATKIAFGEMLRRTEIAARELVEEMESKQ